MTKDKSTKTKTLKVLALRWFMLLFREAAARRSAPNGGYERALMLTDGAGKSSG